MSEDNNIAANDTKITSENASETYSKIRNSIIAAQKRIYTAVNSAMVQAYWEIGEQIYIACGENDRAESPCRVQNEYRNTRQRYRRFPQQGIYRCKSS